MHSTDLMNEMPDDTEDYEIRQQLLMGKAASTMLPRMRKGKLEHIKVDAHSEGSSSDLSYDKDREKNKPNVFLSPLFPSDVKNLSKRSNASDKRNKFASNRSIGMNCEHLGAELMKIGDVNEINKQIEA